MFLNILIAQCSRSFCWTVFKGELTGILDHLDKGTAYRAPCGIDTYIYIYIPNHSWKCIFVSLIIVLISVGPLTAEVNVTAKTRLSRAKIFHKFALMGECSVKYYIALLWCVSSYRLVKGDLY